MGCGCKGAGKQPGVEYEVLFKDGYTERVASMPEVRVLMATNAHRGSATYRAVPAKQTA